MSNFRKNYLNYPELKAEIREIQKLFSKNRFQRIVRTDICRNTDLIMIPLPEYIDKRFYVLNHIAATTNAHYEIDNKEFIGYDYRDISNLSFMLSAAGDKLYYRKSSLLHPEVWHHLVVNHKMYAVVKKLQELFEKYDTTPSVFYADPIIKIREEINAYRKEHQRLIDEVYSECFKNGEVDIKWLSEYNLFRLVLKLYPDATFQYSPEWLQPQRYDVFVKSINSAIEYQGLQHYEPVDYFGGVESFDKMIKRDKRKRELSIAHGIKLYYWKYDVPITVEELTKLLLNPPYI